MNKLGFKEAELPSTKFSHLVSSKNGTKSQERKQFKIWLTYIFTLALYIKSEILG